MDHLASLGNPPAKTKSVLGQVHGRDSLDNHGFGVCDGNLVRSSARSVIVSRPLGEVVEVFPIHGAVYLELHQSGSIWREDDVEQSRAVRADLYGTAYAKKIPSTRYNSKYKARGNQSVRVNT